MKRYFFDRRDEKGEAPASNTDVFVLLFDAEAALARLKSEHEKEVREAFAAGYWHGEDINSPSFDATFAAFQQSRQQKEVK